MGYSWAAKVVPHLAVGTTLVAGGGGGGGVIGCLGDVGVQRPSALQATRAVWIGIERSG